MDPKEKRKRVMSRSIKLGHCVCDPRNPCPCPLFKEKDVCTCAGERVPAGDTGKPVRLTEYVRSAGCASKIGQKDLHEVLKRLPVVEDPRLLVGIATADDAGVFKISPELTIVQTVDVFTPGVDDPYLFGRIAAAHSLSDIYAMGATPVTALSIIGFPIYSLPHAVMTEILRGGMEVLKEAGTILLGGHSINDEEVKFGFAITGVVDSKAVVTNAGAKPGDCLILTKPLGTGIVALANQIGQAPPESVEAIIASMTALNKTAAEIMRRHRATACTDVTGFGLLGHLSQLVKESGVTAELWADQIPLFPAVLELAKRGTFSGANERNAESCAARVTWESDIPEEMKAVLLDAQTSGGLLIALPETEATAALREMAEAGIRGAGIIGRMTEKSEGRIVVCPRQTIVSSSVVNISNPEEKIMTEEKSTHAGCCESGASPSGQSLELFQDFLGAALKPGKLDVVTKELITIALALAVHCVPCCKIHLKKAKGMGISAEELEEAAAIAVAFAGCRALMLWNELKKELL